MILLVVDVQRLIMTNALYNFEQFKSNVSTLINNARSNDIEVIYVSHDDGEESDLTPGKIGFEVYEEFEPNDSEKLFIKKYNSAFKDTELDAYLKSKETRDIAICGLQTDLCIDATIKGGLERGYNMIVVDGCNTTVDNDFLNAKLSVEYYNCYIWTNRYGQKIDLNDLSIMMKKHKNKEEEKNYDVLHEKEIFLSRINEISTTELGKERIRKNLQLNENVDVVEYCKNILKNSSNIMRRGKNWYVDGGNCMLTINSKSLGIITAKQK